MRNRNVSPPEDENQPDNAKINEPSGYYKEDMPRKAVGKLFQNMDNNDAKNETEYPDDVYNDDYINERPNERVYGRAEKSGRYPSGSAHEAKIRTVNDIRSRRRLWDDEVNAKEDPMANDDLPARDRAAQPQNAETRSAGKEEDYDFSIYRRKERERPAADEKTTASKEYVKIERPRAGQPSKPSGERPERDVKPGDEGQPPPSPGVRPAAPRNLPSSRNAASPRNQAYDRYGDGDRGRSQDSGFSLGRDIPLLTPQRLVIAVALIIVLLVLSILVFQLSAANARLAEATEELESLASVQAVSDATALENIQLQEEINRLERELADSVPFTPLDDDSFFDDFFDDNFGENGEIEDPEPPPVEIETYEVKAGDSLGQIAQQFYRDASKHRLIMEANGLTSTNIQVGQKLIIPPDN